MFEPSLLALPNPYRASFLTPLSRYVIRSAVRLVPTEVWFRNPSNYIRELVECGVGRIAWDRGFLVKKGIDAAKHADLFFGTGVPYRILLIGDQGTAEVGPGRGLEKPVGVYPTWTYGEDATLLEEIVSRPIGQDKQVCSDMTVEPDERPVYGQEHRVVVSDLPPAGSGPGRKFFSYLKELQEEYPDCIIHVHGLYGFRTAFGLGFGAADIEPRTSAQKGKVSLPSGNEMMFEHVQQHAKWVTNLGFKPADLAVPRNRCMFNIKSALWCGENYEKLYKFRTRSSGKLPDIQTSDSNYKPEETSGYLTVRSKAQEGDKFFCDTCSLQTDCKFQRSGAVCSVPGAEPAELARYFKTRDSDMIIDGLGVLVAAQTRRLERGMKIEEDFGELDPEVSKLLNSLFNQGVQLAKLVNPSLRGGVKVNVAVGQGGAAQVAVATPGELTGAVVRELEARGIPREKITPELIMSVLSSSAEPEKSRRAIEGQLIEGVS